MITIYKITNPLGKVYVGQTINYRKRLNAYRILNCRKQKKLHNSLKKYGFNNHSFEILEEVENAKADQREQYWIEYFKCYYKDENKGLNLNKGGFRMIHTKESKEAISKALLNSPNKRSKKLYQYTPELTFVKEWSCMRDITREHGYVTTWLSKATKNNKIAYGYRWSYEPLH